MALQATKFRARRPSNKIIFSVKKKRLQQPGAIETGATLPRSFNAVLGRSTAWQCQNACKELDDSAVHKRKCNDEPDRQRKDRQAILKVEGSRLICDKTPNKAFHRAGPSLTTKPRLIRFSPAELHLA
jgi:hypothetical protein